MEWPEQLCPHCGNREEFEFEVLTTMRVPLGPCYDPEELLHNVGLPFNSRVWCRKCGKQGRWNSWQRGAYPVDPEMDERVPDYPINLEITEVPVCYACFLEAEEKRTGWTKMVAVEHGFDRAGNKCKCSHLTAVSDFIAKKKREAKRR